MRAIIAVLALLAATSAKATQVRPPQDDRLALAHYRAGWEDIAAESWTDAVREFQAAIDLNPQFKLAYYGVGRASMALKRFADAIRAYEKCRELYETQASKNFSSKAEIERIMADDLMQIDTAIQQLSARPQTPQTQTQIAQWQMQKQRLQNRTRGMDTLSLTSPVPSFVSLALGSAYLRSERFGDAERAYKAALATDPKYGEAHSNLAVLYLLTNRFADAAKEVKAAEKVGFRVNPSLKDDIENKLKNGS